MVSMQASASMWKMSSSVQKWYGSLVTTLFKLVGSRQIRSFPWPWLSVLLTRTKLFIHGMACATGTMIPACNILLIFCWNASFRWIGIGLHGVCLGVTPGSTWIWYGGPGNFPIPSKTSGYSCRIWHWVVMSLGNMVLWVLWGWSSCLVITCFWTWKLFFHVSRMVYIACD